MLESRVWCNLCRFQVALICLFVLMLYIPVNSYGNAWTVSSPNHTFFFAGQAHFSSEIFWRPDITALGRQPCLHELFVVIYLALNTML